MELEEAKAYVKELGYTVMSTRIAGGKKAVSMLCKKDFPEKITLVMEVKFLVQNICRIKSTDDDFCVLDSGDLRFPHAKFNEIEAKMVKKAHAMLKV